jgi:hypothetical protein
VREIVTENHVQKSTNKAYGENSHTKFFAAKNSLTSENSERKFYLDSSLRQKC